MSFEHREAFARERLLRILQGEVRGVISGLRQMATKRKLTGQTKRDVAQVCGDFKKNAARMIPAHPLIADVRRRRSTEIGHGSKIQILIT